MALPCKELGSDGLSPPKRVDHILEVKSRRQAPPWDRGGQQEAMSSLVKSPQMSPAKVAANQANSLQSTGPATPDGLERVRLGKLRHGLRASDPREVLAFLGEDPDEFDR